MSPLVLASASAARARLLKAAGIELIVDAADIDEAATKRASRLAQSDAAACALLLAETKARAAGLKHRGALVLGADQMLECEGQWFDKPRDEDEARDQLRSLSGKSHELVSAAAVLRDGKILWHIVERPRLTMRPLSEEFLDRYLAAMGERVLHTVGGYELEGLGAQLMERVEGDYFSILGLPLLPLLSFLRSEGVLAA